MTADEWPERKGTVHRSCYAVHCAARALGVLGPLIPSVFSLSCTGPGDAPPILTAEMPLHLEEHLDAATVTVAESPAEASRPVEWRFDEPQPDWRTVSLHESPPFIRREPVSPGDSVLRVTLDASTGFRGGVFVEVANWRLQDWAHVTIRARSTGPGVIQVGFNLRQTGAEPLHPGVRGPFEMINRGRAPLVGDGTVQTYQISMEPDREWDEPVVQLGIWVFGLEPTTVEVLSITAVPEAALYRDAPAGVAEVQLGKQHRRTLFTQAPGNARFRVRVPEGGRLDLGLGVLREDVPVTFRVSVAGRGGGWETVFGETCSDASTWHQRTVDLQQWAGHEVSLTLETDAETPGTVAFWGAPTVSGSKHVSEKPNVIFYVIDGAGAEYMSLYDYNRRTTPNIDRLAAEGAVFERAYSNSSWTRPSTASFMTSLQHSVLGGLKVGFNVVPEDVPTMAQHFHRGGYQTAVFTPNPSAGKMSGLDREVDTFLESWVEITYNQRGRWREGSRYLNDAFWRWRDAYPGEPYWVHFQPVDVHADFPAPAPFSGLFVAPGQAQTWLEWRERKSLWDEANPGIPEMYSDLWTETGIDRVEYHTVAQGLYDEAMAHNDHQVGRLVERLKAEGEWENTLLIVAADHGIQAAFKDMAIAIQDSLPPAWTYTMLRPSITRIPLLFVWPGHIPAGLRLSDPSVSMLDVLPTILDLVGFPLPEAMQGQSLAPLLLGRGGAEARTVFLDEFVFDLEEEELRGRLEVADGRWGASLEVNFWPPLEDPEENARWRRPVPLLLFDLWNDPYCLRSIHEERPDLVERYTELLEAQWEAHLALRQLFTPPEGAVLTPEQLEALRALGYVR